MRTLFRCLGLIFLCSVAKESTGQVRRVVIYDDAATELHTPSPFTQSKDLWMTLAEFTRATGFVVKPQGVCRSELCFPLPKQREADFLRQSGKLTRFNLSEFARLVKQPVAHDEKLETWCFGPRQDVQNGYLATLDAPNFTLPDRSGKPHSLWDFRGKKVLLITWASW